MKSWGFFAAVPLLVCCAAASLQARTWYIEPDGTGDVPTIQDGVVAAGQDDTLLLAPGNYTWTGQGTASDYGLIYILRGSADMTIRSEMGPDVTVLDGQYMGRILFFQGETELTIEGLTFTHGLGTVMGDFVGGAIAAHLSSPVLRNCVFRQNNAERGGAVWYGGQGSPLFEDCLFELNAATNGGAIYLVNSSPEGTVRNCLIRDNTATNIAGAIYLYNFRVTIEGCTFEGNTAGARGGAVAFTNNWPATVRYCTFHGNGGATGGAISAVGSPSITVQNTIVTDSQSGGAVEVGMSSAVSLGCTDIFNNFGGDWTGPIAAQYGVNGNFSADPYYCRAVAGDFSLAADSPCAPGNHPDAVACGLIGAHPVSCGGVPVETLTWGAVKAAYSR